MKKLKLDHELAELVLNGEKWSTWRLFDDKDLSVNDEVELIDKVQPDNPETWQSIGVAVINRIIEKRLGDIGETDMDGSEGFTSRDDMLRTYQRYYGPNVTFDTPVKMVHFDLKPTTGEFKIRYESSRLPIDRVKIYADGGSRGNPGPSASGYVLLDMDGNSLVDINQMKGIFKVKNRDLWPIHDAVKRLSSEFEHISFTQVPRELNKLADRAVNRALDDAQGKTSKNMA